jgi:hypothetical protein
MTEQTEARVAPAAEPALLTEHVNVLMTEETRAFLLGSKIRDGARSEAAVARNLLEDSIGTYADRYPDEYALRAELGRAELTRRAGSGA